MLADSSSAAASNRFHILVPFHLFIYIHTIFFALFLFTIVVSLSGPIFTSARLDCCRGARFPSSLWLRGRFLRLRSLIFVFEVVVRTFLLIDLFLLIHMPSYALAIITLSGGFLSYFLELSGILGRRPWHGAYLALDGQTFGIVVVAPVAACGARSPALVTRNVHPTRTIARIA
jgi:hypothetical protein